MSWWGTLDAEFVYLDEDTAKKQHDSLRRSFEERLAPTGSEDGPEVWQDGLSVRVNGRLRDVRDIRDSPRVLAWFASACDEFWIPHLATLIWDLDRGPRYRYRYADGELTKLRGVLD